MITKVLELVAQINEETDCVAWFDYAGHVNNVDVRVKNESDGYEYNANSYFGDNTYLNDVGVGRVIFMDELIDELGGILHAYKQTA